MQKVSWIKSTTGDYLDFETFNISGVSGSGVYIIWHAGQPSRILKVGQGDIKARLLAHRNDRTITDFSRFGVLKVTWAIVPAAQLDGVERYLGDYWKPLVAERFPDVVPIAVNQPG